MNHSNKHSTTDKIRLAVLTSAELFDAWRTIPRLLVAAYGWMCWVIVKWYMALEPKLIEDCNIDILAEQCITQAPTTQHAALVTVVIGASAAVFGLYTNTGRSWAKGKFVRWDDTNMQRGEHPPMHMNRDRSRGHHNHRDNQYRPPFNDQYEPHSNDQYSSYDNTNSDDQEGFWPEN